MTDKILLVEDDPDIVRIIQLNISAIGYELDHSGDGKDGLDKALNNDYALVLLDLMLPSMGGIEICKRIRQQKSLIPIIIITARSDEVDKVLGLELGADDYITKPFSIREVLARINALLRRVESGTAVFQADKQSEPLTFAELEIRPLERRVLVNGEEAILSAIEFDLLYFLASQPGRPFTREELAERVWGYAAAYDKTVNAQFSRLRKKIEPDPANPRFVKTVRGVGYRFARLEELDSEQEA